MAAPVRERLIDAALALFNERGYRAAGIEAILDRAGVAKMTLYNHFKNKEELIVEALRERDDQWLAWFAGEVERHARVHEVPGAKLLAVFDVLEGWFNDRDFNGCGFIRASGEYPNPADPVHAVALDHKRRVEQAFEGWAREAGAADPAALARAMFVIVSGAITAAQMMHSPSPAHDAKSVARCLLAAHGL